ncbi:MAG: succinate dehydrogenase cytochrome b subunit [Calditrichaeota bacterium]|nr:succinate dehydrogenase cytochrome b subunit [Calditrichota bacterium]
MAASTSVSNAFRSTIVKKILMSLTGLGLVIFVLGHLIGNLSLLFGPEPFNLYSHKLMSLGPLLWVIEIGLVAFFLIHAWNGISVSRHNRRSRPVRYAKTGDAGGPSKKSLSSVSMIFTGIILLVFLVIHVATFKYGAYYTTVIDGVEMRDLYKLVYQKFHDPLYVFGYTGVMILLGFHLRHGFWSAFQSLGTNHPRYSGPIYTIGVVLAIVLAIGFIAIPLYTYFN